MTEQVQLMSDEATQFLGHAHRKLEVAVVDRPQFARQCAPGPLALPPGEAGHAADHVGVSRKTIVKQGIRAHGPLGKHAAG